MISPRIERSVYLSARNVRIPHCMEKYRLLFSVVGVCMYSTKIFSLLLSDSGYGIFLWPIQASGSSYLQILSGNAAYYITHNPIYDSQFLGSPSCRIYWISVCSHTCIDHSSTVAIFFLWTPKNRTPYFLSHDMPHPY